MNRIYWTISIFIIIVIGSHILPLIQELKGQRQTLWPIMAWGMYRNAHSSSTKIIVKKISISAKTESGNKLGVSSIHHPPFFNLLKKNYHQDKDRILLEHYGYKRLFVNPMLKGDKKAAVKLAALMNEKRQDPVTHILIQRDLYELNQSGLEKLNAPTMTYDVSQ